MESNDSDVANLLFSKLLGCAALCSQHFRRHGAISSQGWVKQFRQLIRLARESSESLRSKASRTFPLALPAISDGVEEIRGILPNPHPKNRAHSWHLGRQLSFRTGAGLDILGIRGSHGGLLFLPCLRRTWNANQSWLDPNHWENRTSPANPGLFLNSWSFSFAFPLERGTELQLQGAANDGRRSFRLLRLRSPPPRWPSIPLDSLPRAWRDPPNHRLSHRQMVRQMLSEGIGWQLPSRRWNPPTRLYHELSRCLAPHDFPHNLRQNQWRAQGTQIIKGTPNHKARNHFNGTQVGNGYRDTLRFIFLNLTWAMGHSFAWHSGLSFPGASKSFLGPPGPCIHCLGGHHPTWAKLQMPKISRKTSGKSTRLIMMFFYSTMSNFISWICLRLSKKNVYRFRNNSELWETKSKNRTSPPISVSLRAQSHSDPRCSRCSQCSRSGRERFSHPSCHCWKLWQMGWEKGSGSWSFGEIGGSMGNELGRAMLKYAMLKWMGNSAGE